MRPSARKAQTPSSDTPTTSLSSVGSKRFRSIRRLLPVAAVLAASLSPRASRMSTLRSGRRLAQRLRSTVRILPCRSSHSPRPGRWVGAACLSRVLNDLVRLPRPLPRRPCTSGSSQRSSIAASRRNTSSLRGFRPAKRTRWLAVSADALALRHHEACRRALRRRGCLSRTCQCQYPSFVPGVRRSRESLPTDAAMT